MVLRQLDIHIQKGNLDTDLRPFTKTKLDHRQNAKHKTITLLTDNTGKHLAGIRHSEDF